MHQMLSDQRFRRCDTLQESDAGGYKLFIKYRFVFHRSILVSAAVLQLGLSHAKIAQRRGDVMSGHRLCCHGWF